MKQNIQSWELELHSPWVPCYMNVPWAKRKLFLFPFLSFSSSSNHLCWWQQNIYLLPAKSRRGWVVRALPFLKKKTLGLQNSLKGSGEQDRFQLCRRWQRIQACLGRLWASSACSRNCTSGCTDPLCSGGVFDPCASSCCSLGPQAKDLQGFHLLCQESRPLACDEELCEGSSAASPCTPCPGLGPGTCVCCTCGTQSFVKKYCTVFMRRCFKDVWKVHRSSVSNDTGKGVFCIPWYCTLYTSLGCDYDFHCQETLWSLC